MKGAYIVVVCFFSILAYNQTMMINSTLQLNKFAVQMGAKTRGELLLKLIEKKEIVSVPVAKLIADKLAQQA
jgi:hypothetical protein